MSIRRFWGSLLLALCALQLSGVALAEDGLRERLTQLSAQSNPKVEAVRLTDARVIDDFYRSRGYRFAWNGRARVDELVQLAEGSRADGMQAGYFHIREIKAILGDRDPAGLSGQSQVDVDILLTDSLLRLIHHYRYGKVDPQALDSTWNHAEGPYAADLVGDLERVAAVDDLGTAVRGLMPHPAFYTRLKEGLARYRKIADAGGWKPVPPGSSLKQGMRDGRVAALRERLRASGDFDGPDPGNPKLYDAPLKEAVMRFQKRHNIGVDGVVGPASLAALNVSTEARIDQIRVNLERMRWVYDQLPEDFLLVDLAGQQLDLFRDGKSIWHSRVIVGREERPTPIFRDQVEYLEVNPTWTVPPTILKEDILPNARKNPNYVSKKGLEVVTRGGKKVSPRSVNWNVSAGAFPYLLRQPAGNKNALGRIKFMFPNRFSVYLHDTPNRRLFDKPRRLYSSGCVRVENPFDLAELVLNQPKRWDKEKLKAMVDSKRTRWLHLKEPLPIILSYWTADVGEDGQIRFREDIYKRDAQVLAALDGQGPVRLVYKAEPPAEETLSEVSDSQSSSKPDTTPDITPEPMPQPRTTANGQPGLNPAAHF